MEKNFELIAQKETELLPYIAKMEQLRVDFVHKTTIFAKQQYEKIAKEYVSKNSDHILNMGKEQIIQMKTRIRNLILHTESIVQQIMNNPAFWWHLRPSSKDPLNQYLQTDNKYPIILDQAIRQVLGCLGEILQEFKFRITVTGNYGSFYEYWYTISSIGGATIPSYPHLLEWSMAMQEIIQHYNALYVKAIVIYKEIDLLEEQKKSEEALLRWDSL